MRYFNALAIIAILFVAGCDGNNIPADMVKEFKDTSVLMDSFVKSMEEGKTTRDAEQAQLRNLNNQMKRIVETVDKIAAEEAAEKVRKEAEEKARKATEEKEKAEKEVKKAAEEKEKTKEKAAEPKKDDILPNIKLPEVNFSLSSL